VAAVAAATGILAIANLQRILLLLLLLLYLYIFYAHDAGAGEFVSPHFAGDPTSVYLLQNRKV